VENFEQSATVSLLMTPDQLKAYIDAETSKWIKLARENNIHAE